MPSSESQPKLNYKGAGVDRDAASRVKELIGSHARSTFTPGVLGDLGFFGGLFQVKGFRDPVLVSHTDGVGTKMKVAALAGRYESVGADAVSHCVNDILCCGARPLFFQDYIAMGALRAEVVEGLVKGMSMACREAGCALIGGETAEMPGTYAPGDLDVVGFVVGAVERKRIIDGSRIAEGDVLLGLPSSGLHTNGYSLVRRIFSIDAQPSVLGKVYPGLGKPLGEVLLVPHRCYFRILEPVLSLLKGIAHITGGGLLENVPRILPEGLAARFRKGSWPVLPIFTLIQQEGRVDDREMHRVFNMGIGMVLACAPGDVSKVRRAIPEALLVGQVGSAGGGQRVIIE